MGKHLLDKVWAKHLVPVHLEGGDQLFIGRHLVHEVTSPQAFQMLRERGLPVRFPHRTFATADHIIPTDTDVRPFEDPLAEEMMVALAKNCKEFGIEFLGGDKQGIVHVIGPELGLTLPGQTIVCGDSHTSTHGAFGSIAFGIGTTQVAQVLASGCLLVKKPKCRLIKIDGEMRPGVSPKDVILYIINILGTSGGTGYAYEYAGTTIDAMSMEERMTVCNMSIEGGARLGYCSPDKKTVEYLRGREYAPSGDEFEKAAKYWLTLTSDPDASYDDVVEFRAEDIPPMVTWGTNPGHSAPIDGRIPEDAEADPLEYSGFKPGDLLQGTPIQGAFLGSCTNGRLSDFRLAAELIKEYDLKVAPGVRAIAVPGSARILKQLVAEGVDEVFRGAGWEWRSFGCSACLGMNPDKFSPGERTVSSSNRNYKGRQGQMVKTSLMSPAGVVLSAARGHLSDPREIQGVLA